MKAKREKLHLIIYICAMATLGLTGCEHEIPYKFSSRQNMLIMNALLRANEAENHVYLNLSEVDSIGGVKQARLSVYVNGQLAEEPQAIVTPNPNFPTSFRLHTVFRPGDRIRLEASAEEGKYWAESEVTVPKQGPEITVDTCIASIQQWGSKRSYRRVTVNLNDLPGEKNYYRLEVATTYRIDGIYNKYEVDEYGIPKYDENGSLIYQAIDTLFDYNDYEVINREDIILTDGHISHSDKDEENELFPTIENKYNIFTDSQFANSTATLKVYTNLNIDNVGLDHINSITPLSLTVRLLHLNRQEYLYYRALNCLDDGDYDETLMEPISLPSNVTGGLGFVGVCSKSKVVMELPEEKMRDDILE